MMNKDIENYCVEHSTRPGEVVKAIGEFTRAGVHGSQMLIGEMEAAVLSFLIKLGRVKKVLELGTFTGYSALAMAEQLPEDGQVVTIDINKETTAIARKYWDESPHGKKIKQIIKPGPDALKEIQEKFDLIFIDADKNNYPLYLEWALEHLSDHGLIVSDNTLWGGKVVSPEEGDKRTESIQKHNDMAKGLKGYTKVLLPIRDGMFLITKN